MLSKVLGTFGTSVSRFRIADVPTRRIRTFLLILVAFALVATLPAFSQGISTGSLSGYVADPTGAMVPNAKITATNVGTNAALTTTSNSVGYWAIRAVPIGTYRVTVETANFQKLEMAGVEVTVAKETSLGTAKLSLSRGTEVVEVHEAAPLIESTTSQITNSFPTRQVAELPLAGGFDQLVMFVPGVADVGQNRFSNSNGASFSSNGLRGRSNNFQIDGQANNDNSVAGPSIFLGNEEAIGEVNVITNNFGVEYGRNSGSVVNYVTKSGTNALHGSVFESNLNSIWDAHTNSEKSTVNGFCPPGIAVGTKILKNGTPSASGSGCNAVAHPAKEIDNRYGGSLGGPIIRNKAWFFGSYMEEKDRAAGAPSTSATITPTPAGLTTLASAFPNNPAVKALQTIGPYAVLAGSPSVSGAPSNHIVSNGVTTANVEFANVTRGVPAFYNDWELVGKSDMQLTSKDRLNARYIFQKNINTAASGTISSGSWVDVPAKDQQIALDWVRTISSSVVNQARFSFSRAGFGFEGGAFPNCTRANILSCPTSIGLSGNNLGFGIATNLPQGRLINNTQWQDNASWVHGRHTFKFGGEYDRQRSPNTFLPSINGGYSFSGGTAANAAAGDAGCAALFPGVAVNSTDCSFSRFLANIVNPLSLADGPENFNFKEQDLAFYGGDDWRIKDNLTLNLGLRWEYSTQPVNLLSAITRANQAAATPTWSTALPTAVTTLPDIPNNYHYFAPNVGFAWTPKGYFLGDGKTVIRGGARIAYDPAYYNMFLNVATAAPVVNLGSVVSNPLVGTKCTAPCLVSSGFTGGDVRAAHLADIPRGGNPGNANNTRVTPDFHESRTYLWSFGIEREITNKIVFESRYVGNHVTDNFQTINANPSLSGLVAQGFTSLIPAGVTPCATSGTPGFASKRADCNFTNVRLRTNTAWSYYHGLQNQLRVGGWHNLTATASYTFSKTIDNASEIFAPGFSDNSVPVSQNPFDWGRPEKGESFISFPHTASVAVIYDVPFYKSQKGFLAHLLGGYSMNTTWRYSSGQLWTPRQVTGANASCQDSFDSNFLGSTLSTCRPFWGNPSAQVGSVGQCKNAALSDCGLVDYFLGTPVTKDAVQFIYNDTVAAKFFGTPYGNVGRNPGLRGQAINNMNLSLSKTTKIAERVDFALSAQVFNLMNHLFQGPPSNLIDNVSFPAVLAKPALGGGSYGNNFFNNNGGSYGSTTVGGIGRRRMILGAKFTF